MRTFIVLVLVFLLTTISSVQAGFVSPQIGGGQVGEGLAPMKHISVGLYGNTVQVSADSGVPELRALEAPDEFDPSEPWGVLGTKAYNFQYGWLADNGGDFPPIGAWFWIEQLSATSGLEVYQRPPAEPSYEPIFGSEGSSTRWYWSGLMSHNVYAVHNPSLSVYEADYRVYIGDETTGDPWPGFTAAEITLQFAATPVMLADFDGDDDVDDQDYQRWEGDFALNGDSDADSDGDSDGLDFLAWQREMGSSSAAAVAAIVVPEPDAVVLVFSLALVMLPSRRFVG